MIKSVWNIFLFFIPGTKVTVNAVHPGIVKTELGRHMSVNKSYLSWIFLGPPSWLLMKTPKQGAQTTLFCALDPSLENVSGKYFRWVSLATCIFIWYFHVYIIKSFCHGNYTGKLLCHCSVLAVHPLRQGAPLEDLFYFKKFINLIGVFTLYSFRINNGVQYLWPERKSLELNSQQPLWWEAQGFFFFCAARTIIKLYLLNIHVLMFCIRLTAWIKNYSEASLNKLLVNIAVIVRKRKWPLKLPIRP